MSDDRDASGRFKAGNRVGWAPGQSGNPGGRRIVSIVDALKEQLATENQRKGMTLAEMVAASLIRKALSGNVPALVALIDRIHGRPHQSIDMTFDQSDWRALAASLGLTERDIELEARQLIESSVTRLDDQSSGDETQP